MVASHTRRCIDCGRKIANACNGYARCQDCRNERGEPAPSDNSPAIELRLALLAARKAGETFPDAWSASLAAVLSRLEPARRREWVWVFGETKKSWRYCYLRLGDGTSQPFVIDTDSEAVRDEVLG